MQQHTEMEDALGTAEMLMTIDELDQAAGLLEKLAADAEEYVSRNCPTTDEVQWFSFPTIFERLAYRRVEQDPRELRDVGEPLDRLYADLASVYVRQGDYQGATEALKQAVRWDPMDCRFRLDLAELFRTNGDMNEYLALTYSVFERASDARHLVRAFANFGRHFLESGRDAAAAAALKAAQAFDVSDAVLESLLARTEGTDAHPDTLTREQASAVLAEEGLPDGANAEIALCLLMCATDLAATDRALATTLTVRARDLVGTPAVKALLELIRDADVEGAAEAAAGASEAKGDDADADAR